MDSGAMCMSAANCQRGQICCAEMPVPTLVCRPQGTTCGLVELCATSSECPSGQTCNPLAFMGIMIRFCSPALANDGGGTVGDAGGGG
jgi:Cys-rich repeat protein